MNILDFTLDVWKLFAEHISILELANLLFVSKEMLQKVPILIGANSLAEYEKLYNQEYYKKCELRGGYGGDGWVYYFTGDEQNKFKILKTLSMQENIADGLVYKNIDFSYRQEYVSNNKSSSEFQKCINLPHKYISTDCIYFTKCCVDKSVVIDPSHEIDRVQYSMCTLNDSVTIKGCIYTFRFHGCTFEKDFKIIADNCFILEILNCDGYMPTIEGKIDIKVINDDNFVKIDNKNV